MESIIEINETYDSAAQPTHIKIQLKDHQLKLLNQCYRLEFNDIAVNDLMINTHCGVIAAKVGAGKSLIILSLIPNKPNKHMIHMDKINAMFSVYTISDDVYKNISVIVAPHGIMSQWKGYIEEQTHLKANYVRSIKDIEDIKYDKDLILVSCFVYNDFARKVNENKYYFNKVFFDEADTLSIPRCLKIKAGFYWFVTASIGNLFHPSGLEQQVRRAVVPQNTPWDQFETKVIYPGIKRTGFIKKTFTELSKISSIHHIFLKPTAQLIDMSFRLPDPISFKIICKCNKIAYVLQGIISENVQQMIFAGDIENAIKSINVEKTTEDNLIQIVAKNLLEELENKKIDLQSARIKSYRTVDARNNAIANATKNIVEIETKIHNIKTRINESNIDPITYDEIVNPTIVKCCNQVFDFQSITTYITTKARATCPFCRTEITRESLLIVDDEEETKAETYDERGTVFNSRDHEKEDNLKYLLQNKISSNAKILIFSEHGSSYDTILKTLDELKINCKELKGNTNTINMTLKRYRDMNNYDMRCLFLNARYLGSGINLQNSTDIILYHKMNIELEKQVIGRAQRIGRTCPLKVWYLYYENEE